MSYRKKHIKGTINKTRQRTSVLKKSWFWVGLLALVTVIAGLYTIVFASCFQLSNAIISGADKTNKHDLQSTILTNSNRRLADIFGWKIYSDSVFLFDAPKIERIILVEFPGIEQAKINKKLPRTVVLNITERKPLGAFCDNSNKCFSIDANGVIFEPLASVAEGITIVRQTIQNGQVFTGEEVITKNIINAIYKIQKNLQENLKIDLREILVTSPLRLNAKTSEKWQIYFNLDDSSDITQQLTRLNLLMDGGITDEEKSNLRYVDLRPKDRAIVCANSTCGI